VIVFCNTTPFIALSAIDQLSLLPQLFSQVCVVSEVADECSEGGLIHVPPLHTLPWVKLIKSNPLSNRMILLELDKGEKHTIDMAWQLIKSTIFCKFIHPFVQFFAILPDLSTGYTGHMEF
jgi:uncharacterized protein